MVKVVTYFVLLVFSLTGFCQERKITSDNFWDYTPDFKENPLEIKILINDRLGFYLEDNLSLESKKLLFAKHKGSEKIKFNLNFVIMKIGKLQSIKTPGHEEINLEVANLISKLNFIFFIKKFKLNQNIAYSITLDFVKPKNQSTIPFIFLPKEYEFANRLTSFGSYIKKKETINFKSREEFYNYIGKKSDNLVKSKFDTNLGRKLGLGGVQKIFVQYKLDSLGFYKDVKSRAPHPKLQQEAISVFDQKQCSCIPANYFGYHFDFIFTKPITFKLGEFKYDPFKWID